MRKRKKKITKLNISKCRNSKPYKFSEYIGRILWAIILPFFQYSPRPFFAWRRFLLRLFGAQIGKEAHIDPSARIYLPWNLILGNEASIGEKALIYNLGIITIGDRATISQRVHLCAGTHNYSDPSMPLLRLPIKIGAQAWICLLCAQRGSGARRVRRGGTTTPLRPRDAGRAGMTRGTLPRPRWHNG